MENGKRHVMHLGGLVYWSSDLVIYDYGYSVG